MVRAPLVSASILAFAIKQATATLGITFPVASTSCTGGQPCGPFEWQVDDSVLPLAANFGPSNIGIYTGSATQQTLFFDLGGISEPTTVDSFKAVTIPADAGPNGDFYFVRIESISATDPATGYPLQAFSAKFTLNGMTGQLSEAAKAQIDGSAAPLVSSTKSVAVTSSATQGVSNNSGATKQNTTGIAAAPGNNSTSKDASSKDTSAAISSKRVASGAAAVMAAGAIGLALLA